MLGVSREEFPLVWCCARHCSRDGRRWWLCGSRRRHPYPLPDLLNSVTRGEGAPGICPIAKCESSAVALELGMRSWLGVARDCIGYMGPAPLSPQERQVGSPVLRHRKHSESQVFVQSKREVEFDR